MSDAGAARLVVEADRRLAEQVRGLAGRRMVFFAGLPGTGKSLLVPTEAEAETFIREVERRYADATALEGEIARWWEV